MKKFIISLALILCCSSIFAQNPLPLDPQVRKGKLDNGLTYYIRHNDKPAQRAEFYLATDAGALYEEPDQDGLAHFLEHMCFNGLKNLPDKQMLEYLQKIGAEFGANVNASTGIEHTEYMLNNMPVTREGIIDTCLLVMHDYSHFVVNDPVEIDKERGVILEEKRTRDNADWRMYFNSRKYYFKGSKHADVSLIGSEENLKTFKPESLVSFYQKWYRPDNQAVIVIGDIDVDQIESKIKALFADIPAPAATLERDAYAIPDNKEPVVGIVTDPEATQSSVSMLWKSQPLPKQFRNTDAAYTIDLLKDVISLVMDERFNDICSKADAPFLYSSFGIGELTRNCEAVMGEVGFKDGDCLKAFKAFYSEIEKMKRFGFTDGEIQRACDEILSRKEKAAEGAQSRKNAEFVSPMISNFFSNTYLLDPETDFQLSQVVLPQFKAEVFKQSLSEMITDENIVIVYNGPEKEGLVNPTESQLIDILKQVRESDMEANVEAAINTSFIDASKLKGSAIKTCSQTIYGATELTLKNGLRAVILPTDYKKDQVLMKLVKNGGKSMIPDEDLASFESNVIGAYLSNTGVAGFEASTVSKMLSGKQVSVGPEFNSIENGISASCTPKDLETAFQLMYLYFAQPRFDPEEFGVAITQLKSALANMDKNPMFKFQQEMTKTIYGGHPRAMIISDELVAKADIKTIEKYYRMMYNDAAGATLYIVGNVDVENVKSLVQTYMGSIKKGKKANNYTDRQLDMVRGKVDNFFTTKMETPKCSVLKVLPVDYAYSTKRAVALSALNYILDMTYVSSLREEEGGTYGAGVYASSNRRPKEDAYIQVVFDTNPESAQKLDGLVIKGMEDIAKDGPSDKDMTMTLENLKKNIPESRISNSYWLKCLQKYYLYGEDYDKAYEEAVNSLTAGDVKACMKEFLDSGNIITVMMSPIEQ